LHLPVKVFAEIDFNHKLLHVGQSLEASYPLFFPFIVIKDATIDNFNEDTFRFRNLIFLDNFINLISELSDFCFSEVVVCIIEPIQTFLLHFSACKNLKLSLDNAINVLSILYFSLDWYLVEVNDSCDTKLRQLSVEVYQKRHSAFNYYVETRLHDSRLKHCKRFEL
jgi:hypothetical protein